MTPVKAAASMMPSSAMLMAPPNSESSPPIAGRISGVETRITDGRCFATPHRSFLKFLIDADDCHEQTQTSNLRKLRALHS
jgi:hypothetical protein